jgi:hypothetical protein
MIEDNPSVRFYCLYKQTLDKILQDIEKSRKFQRNILGVTLELYLKYRDYAGCMGCEKGTDKCVHWSPEHVEVNRS